ncbi:hypothetical protein [Paenibacillus sp. RC343]|uniref:hypothetical protein n=1 Tax=Paenibacillus sp. RC343 TaxID=3045841 RepID=UPI0024BB09F8|nr:hypothetical protein [Paenibacillus sp. RC343]
MGAEGAPYGEGESNPDERPGDWTVKKVVFIKFLMVMLVVGVASWGVETKMTYTYAASVPAKNVQTQEENEDGERLEAGKGVDTELDTIEVMQKDTAWSTASFHDFKRFGWQILQYGSQARQSAGN